jgi:hypothetical protein
MEIHVYQDHTVATERNPTNPRTSHPPSTATPPLQRNAQIPLKSSTLSFDRNERSDNLR